MILLEKRTLIIELFCLIAALRGDRVSLMKTRENNVTRLISYNNIFAFIGDIFLYMSNAKSLLMVSMQIKIR